jgi:alpha-L-arabinofuranosidase
MKTNYKLIVAIFFSIAWMQACKKDSAVNNSKNNNNGGAGTVTDTTIIQPTEPAIANTQGFFLDNWQAKTFSVPATQTVTKPAVVGPVTITVDLGQEITKVSNYIYGNNTNPFMGNFVSAPVLMTNLTNLSPNILRFPGGSLSDVYFWDQSSQAPADAPAQLLDDNGNASTADYWFGNNPLNWTMTLDNYYTVLQQTNSTGLITVNYGYARYGTGANPVENAAHYAANWVRYDKGRTKYWEVGNEIYGNYEAGYRIDPAQNKDGQPQIQDGTTYGTHFKIFADSMRAAAAQVGNTGIKIGIVVDGENDADGASLGQVSNWNANVLTAEGNSADFFVVHNYYTGYNTNDSPITILNTASAVTSSMMTWIKSSAVVAGAKQMPVAMDEWNIFSEGSQQMVSNVAGLHAVLVLGEALKNQISMASRWDLANAWDNGNDQGMFSNSAPDEDAEPNTPAWSPRPAFYYMYYFQKFVGDRLVSTSTTSSDVASYGSSFSSGQAGVILVNKTAGAHVVVVNFKNFRAGSNYYYYALGGGTDNNSFSHKVYVNGSGPAGDSGGPANYLNIPANTAAIAGGIAVTIPAYGAIFLVADSK